MSQKADPPKLHSSKRPQEITAITEHQPARKKQKTSLVTSDRFQEALNISGFSIFKRVQDLGFVGWQPPPPHLKGKKNPQHHQQKRNCDNEYSYRYKSLSKATAAEIRSYTKFGQLPP